MYPATQMLQNALFFDYFSIKPHMQGSQFYTQKFAVDFHNEMKKYRILEKKKASTIISK